VVQRVRAEQTREDEKEKGGLMLVSSSMEASKFDVAGAQQAAAALASEKPAASERKISPSPRLLHVRSKLRASRACWCAQAAVVWAVLVVPSLLVFAAHSLSDPPDAVQACLAPLAEDVSHVAPKWLDFYSTDEAAAALEEAASSSGCEDCHSCQVALAETADRLLRTVKTPLDSSSLPPQPRPSPSPERRRLLARSAAALLSEGDAANAIRERQEEEEEELSGEIGESSQEGEE